MAGRRRARRFAVQILYSIDSIEIGIHSNLKKISAINGDMDSSFAKKLRKPLSVVEESFTAWLQDTSRTTTEHKQKIKAILSQYRAQQVVQRLSTLWSAQLEPHENTAIERELSEDAKVIYLRERKRDVRPDDALQLSLNPNLTELYQSILLAAQEYEKDIDEFPNPRLSTTVAYWVVGELQRSRIEQGKELIAYIGQLIAMVHYHEITTAQGRNLLHDLLHADALENTVSPKIVAQENEWLKPPKAEPILEFEPDPDLRFSQRPAEPEEIAFAEELVHGVIESREELDRLIEKASVSWTISRMSVIDRSILRLATFEMLKKNNIPTLVSIDEAIRNAQFFSERGREKREISAIEQGRRWRRDDRQSDRTQDSPRFVNGVLDRIARELGKNDFKRN